MILNHFGHSDVAVIAKNSGRTSQNCMRKAQQMSSEVAKHEGMRQRKKLS